MIGRDLKALHIPPAAPPGAPLLEVAGVRTAYRPDRTVSLSLRRGEILGLAGLIGSGRTELARTLFGLDPMLGGTIRIDGAAVSIDGPQAAIAAGLYLVPEDRKRCGLVLDFPIRDNVTLASSDAMPATAFRVDAEEAEALPPARRPGYPRGEHERAVHVPLRRQPAEGRARQVALHGSPRAGAGRTHPRVDVGAKAEI